jgi:DNA-binding XRE family transcriptional regulator
MDRFGRLDIDTGINAQDATAEDFCLIGNPLGKWIWPLPHVAVSNVEKFGCLGDRAAPLDQVCFLHGEAVYSMLTPKRKDANRNEQYSRSMETMADRIRTCREARGLTQTALAKLVGVTPAAVSQWEGGVVANIKLQTFLKLCEALHTDAQYLIFGSDRGHPRGRSRPPSANHS